MKRKILSRKFFNQPTLKVAKGLIGKFIVRRYRGKEITGIIIETEAYIGPGDRASHAYGNKITKRNRAEYLDGGHIYIYLVYGMHWQLNISTAGEGKPECVLIRAVKLFSNSLELENNKKKAINRPGKVCRYFKLNKSFYAEDVCSSKRIWLEDRGLKIQSKKSEVVLAASCEASGRLRSERYRLRRCTLSGHSSSPQAARNSDQWIKRGPRIGIDYAGKYWTNKPWRFWLGDAN